MLRSPLRWPSCMASYGIQALAYDRWRIEELRREFAAIG
jgi:hypothetical protein